MTLPVTMTIGDLARASGLRASAIRYYERTGLLPEPARAGGRRRYDRRALERLALLDFARQCGFRLAEIRALLNSFADTAPLGKRLDGIAQRKLAELDLEARRIALRKARIERALHCRFADIDEFGRRVLAGRNG